MDRQILLVTTQLLVVLMSGIGAAASLKQKSVPPFCMSLVLL